MIRNDLETDLCAQNTKSSITWNNRENHKTTENLRLFIAVIVIIIATSSTWLAPPTHSPTPQTDVPETLTWNCPVFGVFRDTYSLYNTRGSCIHSILYFIYCTVVVWCTTTMAYRKTEVRRESEKKIILITTARATQPIKRLAAKDIVPRARGGTTLRFARGPGQTRRRPMSVRGRSGGGLASVEAVAERVAAMAFRRTFGTDTNAEAPVRPQNG